MKMKTKRIFISAVVAVVTLSATLCSCSSHDDESSTTSKLSFDAVRGFYDNEVQTRALAADTDGPVVFTWQTSDKVYVYTSGGANQIGSLSPMADRTGNTKTKLDGEVSSQGVSVGDELVLIFPRNEWDYTGQDGTLNSVASKYDYARASATVIGFDDNSKIYATNAIFTSEQSLVKFVLQNTDGTALAVPSLTIIASSGKLVQKCSLDGSATAYGSIVVTPASEGSTFYVALRNDNSGGDSYTLSATNGSAVYTYTKSDVTFSKGKFKTINVRMKNLNDTYTDRIGYDNEGNETWE